MSMERPSFNMLVASYPTAGDAFGSGGRIVNNPAYEHSCALRLSTALETACPGLLARFGGNRAVHLQGAPGHYRRITFPFARSARGLARYLVGPDVGWAYQRVSTRAQAQRLGGQGIIFWKVAPSSGSPNHIDLWDPTTRALRNVGGRTMLWAPSHDIVEYAWFWKLKRGGNLSPAGVTHPLQSGALH